MVEVWLDRSSVEIGDAVSALVRLSNRGGNVVQRETNTCGVGPASMEVIQGGLGGAPIVPFGREWPGRAGEFKRLVVQQAGFGPERELGMFYEQRMLGGNFACDDMSQIKPFEPGDSVFMELVWPAVAREGSVLVPGPAVARATFSSVSNAQPGAAPPLTVAAEAPLEIVGPQPSLGLTMVDFVDAALAEQEFLDWLQAAPPNAQLDPNVTYWPTEDGTFPRIPPFDQIEPRPVVEVGVFLMGAGEQFHSVIVDRETGEALAVRTQ